MVSPNRASTRPRPAPHADAARGSCDPPTVVFTNRLTWLDFPAPIAIPQPRLTALPPSLTLDSEHQAQPRAPLNRFLVEWERGFPSSGLHRLFLQGF